MATQQVAFGKRDQPVDLVHRLQQMDMTLSRLSAVLFVSSSPSMQYNGRRLTPRADTPPAAPGPSDDLIRLCWDSLQPVPCLWLLITLERLPALEHFA